MTTEHKALALFNEVLKEHGMKPYTHMNLNVISNKALCRAIEQHEAFRQEVSDVVGDYFHPLDFPSVFQHFIIPKPKPDPLVAVLKDFGGFIPDAYDFRAALDALGFEIREKNDD